MTQRLNLWYPFLYALLPLLNTLARNPGGSRPDDVGFVLLIVLALCTVVYLVVASMARGRWPRALVPVVVLAMILLGYGAGPAPGPLARALGTWSRQLTGTSPVLVLAVIVGMMVLGIGWLAPRRPGALDRVNTFFTLTGLLLVGWLSVRVAADHIASRAVIRRSALAHELARPVPTKPTASVANLRSHRDIYLIVLDEYANSEILKEQLQFDNRIFQDSLRRLGFTIPALVRSNYVQTLLSLPSLLNFSHLTRLTTEVGAGSTDASLANYLLENNRTVAFLKGQGYRFLFFPSQWWLSTSSNRNADWEFKAWRGFNLGREATRSDLRRSLLGSSALAFLKRDDSWDADYIRRTLTELQRVPDRTEPTFAFAHMVSPHWPYVFQADCRVAKLRPINEQVQRQQAYTEQLICLNRQLLHTVTTILQRSAVPPIILLQGDHGTEFLRYYSARSAASVAPAQARERFGAFGAYYLPGGGGPLFADTVTLVNVMQKVLSHYFAADVAPEPDDLYMSLERAPYNFAKVNPAVLGAR